MPIRFRCAYCNQLMGIARRKAGTVVRCPTCAGQVVVPAPDPPIPAVQLPPPTPGNGPLPSANVFDQQDFDAEVFNPQPVPAFAPAPVAPAPLPVPAVVPMPAVAQMAGGSSDQPILMPSIRGGAQGVLLTRAKILMAGGMAAVLVGLAFAAGFLCAKFL